MIDELACLRSVLVVAPHPDDEALGCGGLIAALSEKGTKLAIVFTTDGGASHPMSLAWPRARLTALRREEASASLAILGARNAKRLHLELPDSGIERSGDAWDSSREVLVRLAAEMRPEWVLVPWRRDPHRDHRDSHALTLAALDRTSLRPRLLEYAIWLDELGEPGDHPRPGEVQIRRLPIDPWRERKRAAVAEHRSQLGAVVHDDPDGFVLMPETIARLTTGDEIYFEARA